MKNRMFHRPIYVKTTARSKTVADLGCKMDIQVYKGKMNGLDFYGPDFENDVERTAQSWKSEENLRRARSSFPEDFEIVHTV